MKKNIKKVFAIVLVALMTVTFCACAAQASEAVSQETVKEVQAALNEAGFDCGTPDGIAGNNTKNAISEYQKANGLTVTGEIDDKLLESLFPPEEPEETEAPTEEAKPAEETTESTAKAEKPAEDKKADTSGGEAQYGMTEEDAMYFTFKDGVLYRLRIGEENHPTYEKMVDFENVEKVVVETFSEYKNMSDYIFEKYFYTAMVKEDGLPEHEIKSNTIEDFIFDGYMDFFHWDTSSNSQITFIRDDLTWVMYYEDDLIKVGKLDGEELTEVMAYENAKEETELFIDLSFGIARLSDDEDSDFKFLLLQH